MDMSLRNTEGTKVTFWGIYMSLKQWNLRGSKQTRRNTVCSSFIHATFFVEVRFSGS